MANELMIPVGADVSKVKEGFEEAGRSVQDFQGKTDKAEKAIVDLGNKGTKSTKDLISEISKMAGAERSLSNYRRQLAQMTKDISDLTVNYRALSEEQKNSDIGKATLQRIDELTKRAGQYKDAIMDAQNAIKNVASDTANWDAAKQGIDALSGALQAFVSMGVLGKKSTEELVKVIANLKAIEAGFNGVIKVTNALQKDSALMMGIQRIQTAALTKAKTLDTAATKSATLAQAALNAVSKANPYLILAAALATVAGAVLLFTKKSNDASSAAGIAAKRTNEFKDALRDAKGEAGSTLAKFSSLQQQYVLLSNEAEKIQWIKDNKKNLSELNLVINDVNDADDVFIKNADKVIKAMQLRAEAAAMMTTYQEQYAEAYKESLKLQDGRQSSYMSSSTFRNDWKKAGLEAGDYENNPVTMQSSAGAFTQNVYTLTESGVKKMNEYWKQQGANAMKQFEAGAAPIFKDIQAKLAEAGQLEKEVGHFGSSGNDNNNNNNNNGDDIKALEGSKKSVQDLISKTQALRDAQVVGTEEWIKQNEELNKLKDQLDEINSKEKRLLNPMEPLKLPVVPQLEGKVEYKPEGLKLPVKLSPQDLAKEYENAASKAGEISQWVKLGVIDKDQAYTMIDSLNKDLSSKGIKLPVELDIETIGDQINNVVDKIDTLTMAISAPINAINGVVSAFNNLNEVMSDPDASEWEQFFAIFQVGETIINAVATVMSVLSTVTDLVTAAKNRNTTASATEAGAEMTEATARGVNTGAAFAEAAAVGAVSGSEAASSVASIPFAGPALAIAAIIAVMAAVVAAIATAKGFSEGGIVGGHSYTGDKILARLNSGELILNQRSQSQLLNQLDSNQIISNYDGTTINIPDRITLTARGTDMEAVLTNVINKKSKI